MGAADLLVKNGRLVTASSIARVSIAAKDGKISWIGSASSAPAADRVVDAAGLYVLPGVIDVHVHLRDPGLTAKEDFGTGTAAAAAGGVTTVFDMPNNIPPTKSVDALKVKIRAAEKAVVDFALYGLLTVGNLNDLRPLAGAGVIGFKCYMGETTGNIAPPSDGEMLDQFKVVSELGLRTAVHAENDSIIQYRIAKLRRAGATSPHAHYESRPGVVEEEAVHRALLYSRISGNKLHLAHLSSEDGVNEVRLAKRAGQDVTAETCPQYLLLDEGDYGKKGVLMKSNPSIKTRTDKAALWEAIADRTIDMIASDHAPHTLQEKLSGRTIFDDASGFPGLETSLALMLTCVNKELLSLQNLVRLTSENPAKVWGLFPTKGCVAVGSDADLTVVDMKRTWKINPDTFVSKAKYSPFEDYRAEGRAVHTVVRGLLVMDDGVVDKTPLGRMVVPEAASASKRGG